MFKIHADLDGYLEDPVFGPLNEKIYATILDVSEPNYADGRLYRLTRTPFLVMRDAYRQLNKIVLERHPEESFKAKYLRPLKDEYEDSHYAQLVFSVVYVVFSILGTKQSERMMMAIERSMAAESNYFPIFKRLASELASSGFAFDVNAKSPMPPDWHFEYIKLNERYNALQHDYEELQMAAFKDKDNQLSIGFSNAPDGSDIPRDSIIQVVDLLNSTLEAKTSNVFKLLRYIFSKTQGDLVELVKFKEEMFDANTVTSYTSNLAFNREFSKIDLIRVFRAIYDLRMIISRDGQDLSLDEYFNTLGDLLDYKLSDANKYFSNSIGEGCSEATITAIFDTLAQALLNKSVRKIG